MSCNLLKRFVATAKHAVLGLLRSLTPNLHPTLPIRINAIAPHWTETGIVTKEHTAVLGEGKYQSADVAGRSATILMADKKRHGELVYSECGRFMDLENGEKGYHALTKRMLGKEEGEEVLEVKVLQRLAELKVEMERQGKKGGK